MSLSYILLHLYTMVKELRGLRGRAVLRDNGAREEEPMDAYTLLRRIEVLERFDDAAVARLAAASRVGEYTANQIVVRRGGHVDSVGIVASGEIEIRLAEGGSDAPPPRLREGQLFGEMSLLTGEPAIADVVATAATQVVHVPHEALTREIGANPLGAQGLAKLLTARLAKRGGDPQERSALARARSEAGAVPSGPGSGPVLVLNLGSSSIKYAVFEGSKRRLGGIVERIGTGDARLAHTGPAGKVERSLGGADHAAGLEAVIELVRHPEHGAVARLEELVAAGHRVVHGGVRFTEATVIDAEVKAELAKLSALAPLHNPANLTGIELCERLLPPGVLQVAVFDTAFHTTMPEHAYRYALPRALADAEQLRRFGFHGTSHKYVSRTATAFLGEAEGALKLVTCHLGNGASIAAVDHGRSVDTSMGLTPLEGLIMGTRSGDVDPGVLLHLLRLGKTGGEIDRMLNKESGLLGLSGLTSDMRELERAADAGHPGALLAIQAFCYRVRKYVGAYAAAMDGLDAIVFTGGIGENGDGIRSRICAGLSFLGVDLDEERNRGSVKAAERARIVSSPHSRVKVLVVPTDEEGAIAGETVRALGRSGAAAVLSARRDRPIPIGVSAHHVHLCQAHVEALWGKGARLTPRNELTQKGQFACEEVVDLVGPKGTVPRVRILGPERPESQVEISRTEEFKLGIDAPIRASGDVRNSPGITLRSATGEIALKEGVICARRHIHAGPEEALAYGLRDRDVVRVALSGERSLIFGDVLVRVAPGFSLEMHIDTDEANAAEVTPDSTCTIDSIQRRGG
jgi:acetate kinase